MTGVFDEFNLPPPLADLVATFSQWVDFEIGASGRADAVVDPVFHYTTGMGLEGILSSGSIRLTDLGQARDDSEFLYGRDLASTALAEAFALAGVEVTDNDDDATMAVSARLYCQGTLSMLREISPAIGPFRFYAASFCRRGDDAFLWREYAARGEGFALKFSPVVFDDPPSAASLTVMDRVIRLGMIYDRSGSTSVLKRAVDEGIRTVRSAGLSGSTDPNVGTTFLHSMSVYLIWYVIAMATRFKKPCFAPEYEMRLLLLNDEKKLAPLGRTDPLSGRRFVPYEFTPSMRSREVLHEITIGPRAPSDSEAWIRRLLLDHGYPVSPDGEPLTLVRRSAS